MRLVLRVLRIGLAVSVVCVGFLALTEVLARLAWLLPELGRVPAGAAPSASGAAWKPPGVKTVHRVAEWPLERGRSFREAPMIEARVASGSLPPVEERLPENPLVIIPPQQCGPYGGTWRRLATSPSDIGVTPVRICYDGLLRFGPLGNEILPNLASRWSVEDEGRVFTFRLRKGVRWSDGSPFSAADILFWYQDLLLNTELTPTVPSHFVRGGEVMVVEKVDDYTIRFRFKEPYGLFPQLMASRYSDGMVMYPAHYLRQFHPKYTALDRLKEMARAERLDFWYQLFAKRYDWNNPDLPRLSAWTIKQPPPARPVIWERNPYYWKVDPEGNQLPYIDRLSFDIYRHLRRGNHQPEGPERRSEHAGAASGVQQLSIVQGKRATRGI